MFDNDELTAWLEDCVKNLFERNKQSHITSAAIITMSDDKVVLTGYYNCDAQDKAIFAHNLNADAMLDTVCNNADIVKQAIEELDDFGGNESDEVDEDDQGDTD